MKKTINIVTLLVFCSLFIRASFAQQEIPSVLPYKDFLDVKNSFFEDKSFQNSFLKPLIMYQSYEKNSKEYEENISNKPFLVYGNVIGFEVGYTILRSNVVFILFLEVPNYPNKPMEIQLPLNLSDNSKNKILELNKGDLCYFFVKGNVTPMTNEAISVLNEEGKNDVVFGKNIYEMWNCQYDVPSKNSVNELKNNLEKQQCYDYIVSISEALRKYFDDAVNLTKALNPNATLDDAFIKEIENSILNKNKEINIKLLIEKGFLKEKSSEQNCSYYIFDIAQFPNILPIRCNLHGISWEVPCSFYIKAINNGVKFYNLPKAMSKMHKLDLQALIKSGCLKENPYFSKCIFSSEGDLTKDGYIKCLDHDVNNKERINEILKIQNNISQESPCSSFFKNIEQAVEVFNSKYDEKMTELDLGFLTESQLLNVEAIPSRCLFTSVGDITKDGYIKCLIHEKISKDIDEKTYLKKINNTKSKYKIPMAETKTIKNLVEKIKSNNVFEENMFSESLISNANFYKVNVDLNPADGEEALEVAKIVQEFYTKYLIYKENIIGQHQVTPITRIILNIKKNLCFDYQFLEGNGGRNLWIIDEVKIEDDKAIVKHYWSDKNDKYAVICKKINGKWFIDDLDDYKKHFSGENLGVVTKKRISIYSKDYREKTISFDWYHNIIYLKKADNNYYEIDTTDINEDFWEEQVGDFESKWFVKKEDVIPFNFFNKIKKGEDKYMAYIVLGEPQNDMSNKLYYSSNDYISYDNNGKITSWTGFEDLKEFFDDGTGSNNQNIGYVNAKSGINLREEPNTKSEKVCGFPFNTKVIILDKNGPQATFEKITSNWYLITDRTRVGWAFGGFIRAK